MIHPEQLYIKEFDYSLPHHRIAEFPLPVRDQSKLLVYTQSHEIIEDIFSNISHFLPPNSSVVLNDTRVLEARILFKKPSGGVIEIFCLEPHQESIELSLTRTRAVQWKCLIGGASKWKNGQVLEKQLVINDEPVLLQARYVNKEADSFNVEFSWTPLSYSFSDIIHKAGNIPLPPYIKRNVTFEDADRYQTIFSRHEGSVAAPTAALHFTDKVFQDLVAKHITVHYITLHVGAGTFKPVKSETISGHQMHSEPFMITRDVLNDLVGKDTIVATGTTTLRTLETIYWLGIKLIHGQMNDDWTLGQWEAYELAEKFSAIPAKECLQALLNYLNERNMNSFHCQTSLMIVPGYSFKIVKGLITNFHQPQSTLLLLVSAFIGEDWKKVYEYALNNDFRFLSYGDSSLLWRKD